MAFFGSNFGDCASGCESVGLGAIFAKNTFFSDVMIRDLLPCLYIDADVGEFASDLLDVLCLFVVVDNSWAT